MRRVASPLGALVAVSIFLTGLGSGTAAAATKKLIQGTVYDTTCATSCEPACPPIPCGPVTRASGSDLICAQTQRRRIVCPLGSTVTKYPIYSGEGATVKVRGRGSATVIATLPVVEGHFKIALGTGEYVFHPYLPEEPCWSGKPWRAKVWPREQGPIPLQLLVSNSCVAHPDTR
jgi:hypothetical protein